MTHKTLIKISLLLVLMLTGPLSAAYAQKGAAMKGMVRDEFGKPLVGVAIRSANGNNRSVTQKDGSYSIDVNDGSDRVVFSYLGYADQSVPYRKGADVDVKMLADGHYGDQTIHMGYTDQKLKDVSGAVSVVTGDELRKSPVASLSQALTGRLTGLYLDEYQSEPTREKLYAIGRGLHTQNYNTTPLVVIDGIPCSYNANESYQYINANEIETVTFLKDASTAALYGIQGANGVLVITTKRGQPGRTKIEASFDQSFQQWITHPRIYSSWEYATMRRQAAINDGLSGDQLPFTEEQIAQFKSGENRELYPDNDWYHMFMKRLSSQQRVNVNVSGGNDNVRFFSNVSFLHQGSWFKTENEEYKSNPNFTWFNYRTNVDVKLNKYLSGYVNLSGNIRRERTPDNATYSLYGIYQSLFIVPPTTPGPLTPDGKVVVTQDYDYPAYGRLNRAGFTRTTVTNINSQVGLNLDMSFLTKGLSLSGVFAYQTNANGYHITTQSYEKYRRTDDYNVLEFVRKGSDIDTPLSISKGSTEYYHLDGIVHLDYARRFGRHSVSAMGYMLYQSLSQQYTGSGANNLNYKRLHSGFQATYGYDDRYLVKFDLGYSGSDQFARDHRFMATPSVSGAWVASNEAFLRDSRWLTLLKIRASYGKTANDLLDSQRFSYMDDVRQVRGGTVTAYRYVLQEGLIGNPLFEAEVSKKQNYGIDIGLFNSLTLSLDYFKERMDNMVVQAVARIPAYQGVPLGNYPKTNVGKFENHGVDLSLGFTKQINKDWRVFAYGTFTWADNKVIDVAEAIKDEGYVYRHRTEGFPVGTQFGYVTDGYYNTQEELDAAPEHSFGTPRLGDLKYVDLNEDGRITEADQVPLNKGWMPKIQYSFSAGFTYRSWDFSVLFQGQGQCNSVKSGVGIYENNYSGIYGARHWNAWTWERVANGEPISGPALSMNTSTSHQPSDYYLYDLAFLRLKNVMISYTLPARISRAISAEKVRIYLSGQNLWTWDRMKSGDFGPESNYWDFPAYRTYNIGINVVF